MKKLCGSKIALHAADGLVSCREHCLRLLSLWGVLLALLFFTTAVFPRSPAGRPEDLLKPGKLEDFIAKCDVIVRGRVLQIGHYTVRYGGLVPISPESTPIEFEQHFWYATVELNTVYYPFNMDDFGLITINVVEGNRRNKKTGETILENMFVYDLKINDEYIFFLNKEINNYYSDFIPSIFSLNGYNSDAKNDLRKTVPKCAWPFSNSVAIPVGDSQSMEKLRSGLVLRKSIENINK